MDSRERVLTTLQGGIPDRVPRTETIWNETLARWRQEGLAEDQDVAKLFGFDFGGFGWFDLSLQLPTEVIEETDEYIIQRDGNGVTQKEFKSESGHTPLWMDHTLKDGRDWLKYRERLVWDDSRMNLESIREAFAVQREQKLFIPFCNMDCFECAWHAFGQVAMFTMMLDEPEMAYDVFSTWADMIIAAADSLLSAGIDYDGAYLFGDFGYRNGTLFSPECYRSLVLPHHTRICNLFADQGKPVILHSCGKIESFIPMFIEAGFSAIQPLEAKVGQDVRVLKEQFGSRVTLFGNIDIRKLSGTREDVEEEVLSKLSVAKKGGGYIFHSDHSVPPTVPFDNYLYAMELVDNYGNY